MMMMMKTRGKMKKWIILAFKVVGLDMAFTLGVCSGRPDQECCYFPGYFSGNEKLLISLGG